MNIEKNSASTANRCARVTSATQIIYTYLYYHLWGGKSRKMGTFRPTSKLDKNIKDRT